MQKTDRELLRSSPRWAQLAFEHMLVLLVTGVLTFPFYIAAYRISVADLVPIDDYRVIVASIRSGKPDKLTSPFGYRILTPALAVPLMNIDPPLFTRTSEDISQEWIRTTFALCTISYIFLVFTTIVLYTYMRNIGIPICGILSTLAIFWLSPAREIYLYPMTDASAIFFISVLHWAYERDDRKIFLFSSLLGVAAKEITIIVAGLTLFSHSLCWSERRKRALTYILLLLPSVTLYILARAILRFPGNEAQLYVGEYPARFLKLPNLLFNLRGILLNIYPLWPIIFSMLVFMIIRSKKQNMLPNIFHWSNILVTVGLIIIGVVLDVKYNIGRIAFFSFPLFTSVMGWGSSTMIQGRISKS